MTDPLVPPEVDLRGLEYMPFFGNHLFGSEFNATCTDAEWRAGVTLWWAAWNQQPAGSLPNDDVALCRLADLGRDIKAWRRVKANALRGFIECADGRLYHTFLCKQALIAWDKRQEDRQLREHEKDRKKRERDRRSRMFADLEAVGVTPVWNVSTTELSRLHEQNCPRDKSPPVTVTIPVTGAVTGTAKTGRDGTGREDKSKASPASGAGDPVKDEIWKTGRAFLGAEGMDKDRAGSFLGKLCKDYGQVLVLQAVRDCATATPAKPSEWLVARCQERRANAGNRQVQLENRNRKATEGWKPPELRNAS